SLAMLMAERGTTPAGLDAEMAIDHARAMMYPGYPDIDTLLLPEGALLYEDQGLVFVDDDSHSVYFDLMAYDPSVPQGIAHQGGEAVFGYTWDALDTLLEAHGAVIAHGHITDTWRERFTGEYGSSVDGAVSHFIAVFVSTVADSYVVCDPMHRGGAVLMTQGELQAFFQSPVSVYDTTIRLVAWEGASEEVEEVEEETPEVEVDPYAMALDVTAHRVTFDEGVTADDYSTPYPGTGFSLSGHEFWQKWSGGKNPTYLFGEGSDYGKRCMVASAKRFEAIMSDPPQAIQDLKSGSNWGGSFFNWNDDYALSDWGDGTSARLWAWKTGLIKWISQTNRDGSCYLPTLEMVETLAEVCLERAAEAVGEIVGCKAP
ncbi:MAG: hypothetical protein QF464_00410, partial [Myxococcota bacterium]|nr:hypothetical protein [Myxococcota bacterium]